MIKALLSQVVLNSQSHRYCPNIHKLCANSAFFFANKIQMPYSSFCYSCDLQGTSFIFSFCIGFVILRSGIFFQFERLQRQIFFLFFLWSETIDKSRTFGLSVTTKLFVKLSEFLFSDAYGSSWTRTRIEIN